VSWAASGDANRSPELTAAQKTALNNLRTELRSWGTSHFPPGACPWGRGTVSNCKHIKPTSEAMRP
jgi:hypothetical protein